MAPAVKIAIQNQNPLTALQYFLKNLLKDEDITAILVPSHLADKKTVMPMLVTNPEKLDYADPLAPVFPVNAAKIVSKLTRTPINKKLGVVLRPCEIRAFIELVKLNQGSMEDLIIIGIDCLGAFKRDDYAKFIEANPGDGFKSSLKFLQDFNENKSEKALDFDIARACRACEHPSPENADISIGLIGLDFKDGLPVMANTERGEQFLNKLHLPRAEEPEQRKKALKKLVENRTAYRDNMFEETRQAVSSPDKLAAYLVDCVNCYNCRVVCPACYCRECVFLTDIFDYKPWQYLGWAEQKGALKMPVDTLFYHLTRLTHISLSCVGCGQCSNACPNNIPIMELFRTIAADTQKAFNYEAGRNLDEPPPMSLFEMEEFQELTDNMS